MQLLEIGHQVAQRRAALQLSHARLAKLAGLSRLTVNQLDLDEAPLPVVVQAVEEAATQAGLRPKRIWRHLANWSRDLHLYREVWQ